MIPRFPLVLFCFLLAACAANAQNTASETPKIEPDRRDFTLGTGVVPLGQIQLESGATYTRSGAQREITLGELTIRVPLSPRAEVRLGLPSYRIERQTERRAGADDSEIGARLILREKPKQSYALTLSSMLPTGARRVAERRFQPRATLAAQFELSSSTNVVFNLGAARPTDSRRRFTQYVSASSIRFDASEQVQLFSEFYVLSREERGGRARKFAALGAVYFPNRQTALDARFGFGLNNDVRGPDYLVSAGISRLF